jgi:WD40 repeat protein
MFFVMIHVIFRLLICLLQVWIISHRGIRNIFSHGSYVNDLNFSPDGYWIASTKDRSIRIWRLRDGFSRNLDVSTDPFAVRFSMDGRHVASGLFTGQVFIWNVRTGNLVAKLESSKSITSLAFTPDGKGLLGASWDESIIHWDVGSLRSLDISDPPTSGMKEISRLLGHSVRSYNLFILLSLSSSLPALLTYNQHLLGFCPYRFYLS